MSTDGNDYKNSPKNTACTTHCVVHVDGGEGGIRPAALGQCRRQPGELKNHSLDGFSRHRRAVPFSSLLLLCSTKKRPQMRSLFRGGEGGIRPAALGQCRRQPGELKNHSLDGFSRHRRAVPFSSLLLLCSTKKRPQMRSLFRGGEGGIRTLAPVTPAYSLSRGAPYSHLGTSPRIYCRRYVELSGGERGIRTPGALRHHWFSRPAP